MKSEELRDKFLKYFKKKRHRIMPSGSLIPQDKTVLLTTAGMQQFVPYLSGEKDVLKDLGARHLCSVQKCFRTIDIEQIGDDTHHTFFEMLGNWSIGQDKEKGYFKQGAIKLAVDFLTEEMGLNKNKFWITIFQGSDDIPADKESFKIWQANGIPQKRIKKFGPEDNFWGPTADSGPCGPCSEIHYDRGEEYGCQDPKCGPNCARCKRFVEIWNLVFMEYNKKADGSFIKLSQSNVDTGIGFERLLSLLDKKDSAYETDLFEPIIKKLENISGLDYQVNKKAFRIIADHIRGACFLIADKVLPSNIEQGYILRRILRRIITYAKLLKISGDPLIPLVQETIDNYKNVYSELGRNQSEIITVVQKEEEKFEKALEIGIASVSSEVTAVDGLTGKIAFNAYESLGVPLEISKEIATRQGFKIADDIDVYFKKALKKHQEISRAGAKSKFGGVGERDNYQSAKLHTATHLLHQALRTVLGEEARQMGSDINSQRLRFDFSYSQKMTEEEKEKVESLVNEKIKQDLEVKKEEMGYGEAIKSGALAFFKEKYPEEVSVYSVGDFSREICAGPHVKRTSELGCFKIIKEESSGSGVRRIRAILEQVFD